ncbi:AEC family transporter [Calothrix sp. UHCC 0171]|uniref:AEC family transporter n=1 Tax=Calothrix sp. UHCC 0171 TaxID=3110245 RepID=UPI002B21ADBD|nr:AEC family transporter [Calothrix sp. UHCC 0171]MEA5570993.1 AEC family transporter [Calothrix sp. UHCC 0171]
MTHLLELYAKLIGLGLIGFILGRKLPAAIPARLGQFLFWVGVPTSIVAFLRKTDLSEQVWIAPAVAYAAILLGAVVAVLVIYLRSTWANKVMSKSTQGSLILAAMVGNTGYLGYPIVLSLVGTQYFAWALFYDLLGTTLGAYGFGVALAAKFGNGSPDNITNSINSKQNSDRSRVLKAILINPALWSFGLGLLLRQVTLPNFAVSGLDFIAWSAIATSLILIGMRLSQLSSWGSLKLASISLTIKMIFIPLILGICLHYFGLTGKIAQVIVLQMAMPPAFATLVLAETFNLDRELAVTALALGSIVLLITLPFWLWFFR